MQIKAYMLGPLQTNGYLMSNNGRAVFVDPGGDPAEVVSDINAQGLKLEYILNTHFHFDHVLGNAALAEATGAKIVANPKDKYLLGDGIGGGGMMGMPKVDDFEYEPISEGDMEFIGLPCKVLETPGHTLGSLSFYFPDAGAVFVGDLLFFRSIGRTDFPGGNMDSLLEATRNKIFTLPPETTVFSGHGPKTNVADEKNHNPFFR
jgi:glyoxylase-like metal-dependent hydrolase (beta-lactamase superfamily II)